MKRTTTARGAPKTRKELESAWDQAWKDLSQEQIQRWIERIPVHIQEIIRLEGGNEYKEDNTSNDHLRDTVLKGVLSKHTYLN
jgi:arsenate reductase-like glutaredoxin family protein